ncbi:MAG: A/G-specific adenine glycosylase [Acidobacteriaceae bacterium]
MPAATSQRRARKKGQSRNLAILASKKGVFRTLLLNWYKRHRRDLPWRVDRDPYRVWLSEIMLQQTRVAAVIDHYRRFLTRFPTIKRLAAAREASVLAVWSGLGYYRRARMLHLTAKTIVKELNGEFPSTAESLRKLPGIGRYTAAAIASIAFEEPAAAVDGNVERVLRRVVGSDLLLPQVWALAETLLSHNQPGDFNQAMMELGAMVCLPRNPICTVCPIFDLCVTKGDLKQKGKITRQRKREIHYALPRQAGSVFLVQRHKDESLMPGMWEFPEIVAADCKSNLTLRHSITVTDYVVRVACVSIPPLDMSGKWVLESQIEKVALTGLARKILVAAEII